MAKRNPGGLVYSTDSSYFDQQQESYNEATETLAPNLQKLRIQVESKHRGGKMVTVINGFIGLDADLNELGKKLKTKCGTGGSIKDGQILIQGDYKAKIITYLIEWGYKNTK
jgi:translation initiation factor 1